MKKIIYILIAFILSCSTTETEKESQSQQLKWPEPFFNSQGGSQIEGDPYKETFCTTFNSADAFIYGEILSIEWTQDPFLYVDSKNYEKLSENFSVDANDCVGISPSIKIKLNVTYNISKYGIDKINQDIEIFMSGRIALGLHPTPMPNYSQDSGERIATLKSGNIDWYPMSSNNQNFLFSTGKNIGLFLNYEENHNIFYIGSGLFLWTENLPDLTESDNDLMSIYENIFKIKTLDDIQKESEKCSGDLNDIANLRRDPKSKELFFYKNSLPTCIIDIEKVQ